MIRFELVLYALNDDNPYNWDAQILQRQWNPTARALDRLKCVRNLPA